MDMKERKASCACGEVSITFQGEPERVIRCHCDYCQRRTGNVFQVSAWFFEDQIVERIGETKLINGGGDNPGVDYRFCPRCGSTVYWDITFIPEIYGVAVGAFADSEFPQPDFEAFESKRHGWIQELDIVNTFKEFPPIEALETNRK